MNISNRNFFSYKCELPKNFQIYFYDVCDISLLTFFRWLGWYHWARFYVVIKIIHGFRIKVSYKKNKITRYLGLSPLLFEIFVKENMGGKTCKKRNCFARFQKTHYIILPSSLWNWFIVVRKDPSKLPHLCLSRVFT